MPTKLKFPLLKQAVDEEVHRWFDCLANGDYEAAYNLTFHGPYYEWTPELIESMINSCGLPHEEGETKYVLTDWRIDNGKDRGGEFNLYDKHVENGGYTQLGYGYYEVPLNGEWGDLSAVFRIVRYKEGAALLLAEVHVL